MFTFILKALFMLACKQSTALSSSQMHYWLYLKWHFKSKKNSRHHQSENWAAWTSAWKVLSQWTQRLSFLPVGYHQPPPWSTSTSKMTQHFSLSAQRSAVHPATYTVSMCVKIKTIWKLPHMWKAIWDRVSHSLRTRTNPSKPQQE